MSANKLFDSGIKIAGPFSAPGEFPVDGKFIVETIEQRDDHVVQNRAYEGMLVYVKENKKTYQYIDNDWIEFGSNMTGSNGDSNQNAFSNILINGITTIASTETTDTLNIKSGKGIDISSNAQNKTITISATIESNELFTEQIEEINSDLDSLATRVGNVETIISGKPGNGTIIKIVLNKENAEIDESLLYATAVFG